MSDCVSNDNGGDSSINTVFKKISEPLNIHFEDISCMAYRRTLYKFWKPERKQILKNVNGDFVSGKLTGIIGPSGCGKSTLLDIISGYRLKNISGNIYVNGRERNIQKMIKQSCYIMQDDLLEPFVTVEEAMLFVANVKLSASINMEDKEMAVSKILHNFGLDEHRHTLTKDLSGGQRKRLALSLELISNPPLLFLDEPTSGLDSKSAKQCVQILRDLSSEGRTVVCSIHQPSMSILDLFDNVYMLTAGECIYQGTVTNIIPYLKANGLECPMYNNPVEYVMELCVLNPEEANVKRLVESISNGQSQEWFDKAACWSTIPLNRLNTKNANSQYLDVEEKCQYSTSFGHQFWHLLIRKMRIETRDPFLVRMRLLVHLIGGLMLGLIFYNIGNDGTKSMVIMNLLFFAVLFTMYNALTSRIISFPQNLAIIRREYFNRWYSVKAFYLSSLLADIPIQLLSVTMCIVPLYYLSGQPLDGHRMIRVLAITNLLPLVFQDYGILVGTLLNVQNGLIFGMLTTSPYIMFSGFFLYYRDTPKMFQWLYETSVLRHAVEAVMVSVFGYGREPLDCDQIICFYKYPKDFLKMVDIEANRYTYNLIFILSFGLAVKLMCFIALKYKLSRGAWPIIPFLRPRQKF